MRKKVGIVVAETREGFAMQSMKSYMHAYRKCLPDVDIYELNITQGASDLQITHFLNGVDNIIVGGSFESVHDGWAWINDLFRLVNIVVERSMPMLGVCFGHHVITMAHGGTIERRAQERGVVGMHLTSEGRQDPLFEGLPNSFTAFTNHGDYLINMDKLFANYDTRILADNQWAYQSVAIGDKIRTVQFHPEFCSDLLLDNATLDDFDVLRDHVYDHYGSKIIQNFVHNF